MNILILKQGLGYNVFWDKDNDIVFTSHEGKNNPQKWTFCSCIKDLECGIVSYSYVIHHAFDEDEKINCNYPVELRLHNASKRAEISFEEAICFEYEHHHGGLLNELRHGHAKLKELI